MRAAGSILGLAALTMAMIVPAAAAGTARDHSWVRSSAVLYYANMYRPGVYRIRLNRNGVERALDTGRFRVFEVIPPPAHSTWIGVYASRYATAEDEHTGAHAIEQAWLFDLRNERQIALQPGEGSVRPVYSHDGSRGAWLTFGGGSWHLVVMTIATTKRQTIALDVGRWSLLGNLRWSRDERRLLFDERPNLAERSFKDWSVDVATGSMSPAGPNAEPVPPEPPTHFTISACPEDSEYCRSACWDDQAVQSLTLSGGVAAFMADDQNLMLRRPGGALETVASRPEPVLEDSDTDSSNGCGIPLSLYAAFEGRYLLYRKGLELLIYDVVNRRRAVILDHAGYVNWLPQSAAGPIN